MSPNNTGEEWWHVILKRAFTEDAERDVVENEKVNDSTNP